MIFSSLLTASFYFDLEDKTEELQIKQSIAATGTLTMQVVRDSSSTVDVNEEFLDSSG